MIQTYFHQLHKIVCAHIQEAKHSIHIAVSWFSHKDIFDALIKKISAGVEVTLLIEYDTKNFSKEAQSPDFQSFIDAGGKLYVNKKSAIMHHKFMIVDNAKLLTGSYNWTYNTNAENLLLIQAKEVVEDFQAEYLRLLASNHRLLKVKYEGLKLFSVFPLFEESYFQWNDLRKKVTNRVKTWYWVAPAGWCALGEDSFPAWLPLYRHEACDAFFEGFWKSNPVWDKLAFKQYLLENKQNISRKCHTTLKITCLGFAKGDIVLLTNENRTLQAIGIIQSEPLYQPGVFAIHCLREVQWLTIAPMEAIALNIPKKSMEGKYKDSVLALLHRVFAPA